MRESFMHDQSVQDINKKIQDAATITDKKIGLSVELLSKNAWESSLMTYLDEVPFHYIGKGEQCIIKTRLALSDKKAKEASIILMEEPENHLTHTRLNQLLNIIKAECEDRQVIISTHSSFVANKLDLSNLICLTCGSKFKLSQVSEGTRLFFEKLPGYDTLRLVLSQKTILVEGASDELVVQKAYMNSHDGKLPIEDGIDVISVGMAFLRFLEVAEKLDKIVAVVTDNDGNIAGIEQKYSEYLGTNKKDNILISYDKADRTEPGLTDYNYNTLENLMLVSNNLQKLNLIFSTAYTSNDDLRKHMKNSKTDCALAIFNCDDDIAFPQYITEAIDHVCK